LVINVVKVACRDDAANTTTLPDNAALELAAGAELAGADVVAAGVEAAADVTAAEVAAGPDDVEAVFFDELHALRLKATATVAITTADGRFIDSPANRGRRVAADSGTGR
jgi:hypothetical protein